MSAARRYLDKAKEAAEALKTAASLSAALGGMPGLTALTLNLAQNQPQVGGVGAHLVPRLTDQLAVAELDVLLTVPEVIATCTEP